MERLNCHKHLYNIRQRITKSQTFLPSLTELDTLPYLSNTLSDWKENTRLTIGNWKNDRADGFLYQTVTDNETNETSVFYGEFEDGAKHGNSIITTEETGVNSVLWKKGQVISHTIASMLLDEASNAWVQHKYFDNTASYSKKNN